MSKSDIEVYLRLVISNNLSSRKMMKVLRRARWLSQECRYEIVREAYLELVRMKRENIQQNYRDFKKMQDKYDEVSMEKHPQTPEVKFLCFELLEQRKFNLGEDKEFHSFQERFDQLPMLPLIEEENLSLFHDSALFFLKDNAIQNIGLHALLFRINNIVSLLYAHQAHVLNFLISEQASELHFYKDSNRISDLTALEEKQLKSYLREEIRLKVDVQLVSQDWLKLLNFKHAPDRYEQLTDNMLRETYKDAQSELIIQFCGLNDEEATRKFIASLSQTIKDEAPQKLFLIAENRPYVESSHLEISLELLNDLFSKTKDKEYEMEIKKSIKPEHLKLLENMFEQLKPNQAILETRQLLDLLTMRDQRRKIMNILNAFRSIERRITYDLIAISKAVTD